MKPFAFMGLSLAGALCGCFLPRQDLVWAVLPLTAAALAFSFLDMYLAKKSRTQRTPGPEACRDL
jgi:hypothetical protein